MQLEQTSTQDYSFKEFLNQNDIPDQIIYHFDQEEHNNLMDQEPWNKDPNYFQVCSISVTAAIKMLIHACLGKNNEVMGLMQGNVRNNQFIIYDVIQLNAEASETNVSLTTEAMIEFIAQMDCLSKIGREHPVVGWYHSHPSYGCWLSGTDVAAQELQQAAYKTFVAVVVDPIRSMTNQKLDIGAFRVYPRDYQPMRQKYQDDQISVPVQKIKDFGLHHERYYSLKIEFFNNSIDHQIIEGLWKQYWGIRLAQNSLRDNSQYLSDSLCDLKDKCYLKYDQQQQGMAIKQVDMQSIKDSKKYSTELAGVLLCETIKQQLFK